MRATNDTLRQGVFRVHQRLLIDAPCCRQAQCVGHSHFVHSKETLYSIARRYGSTVEIVAQANNIIEPFYIQVGQMLCIPGCVAQ